MDNFIKNQTSQHFIFINNYESVFLKIMFSILFGTVLLIKR